MIVNDREQGRKMRGFVQAEALFPERRRVHRCAWKVQSWPGRCLPGRSGRPGGQMRPTSRKMPGVYSESRPARRRTGQPRGLFYPCRWCSSYAFVPALHGENRFWAGQRSRKQSRHRSELAGSAVGADFMFCRPYQFWRAAICFIAVRIVN
jgi:hypothetical protein